MIANSFMKHSRQNTTVEDNDKIGLKPEKL